MISEAISHYKILSKLGAGGMGEVYLAEDTRLGRQVALKFLPASYQYDPDRRARFLKEARAASALHSPNIAALYDLGEHEGAMFIVMEYIEGDPISGWQKTSGNRPPAIAANTLPRSVSRPPPESCSAPFLICRRSRRWRASSIIARICFRSASSFTKC